MIKLGAIPRGRKKFEMLLASKKLWANHVKNLNNQSKIKLKKLDTMKICTKT